MGRQVPPDRAAFVSGGGLMFGRTSPRDCATRDATFRTRDDGPGRGRGLGVGVRSWGFGSGLGLEVRVRLRGLDYGDGPRENSPIWVLVTSSEPASHAEDIPHHS